MLSPALPQSSPWVSVRLRWAVAGTLTDDPAGFEDATPVPAWIAKTLVRGAGAGLDAPSDPCSLPAACSGLSPLPSLLPTRPPPRRKALSPQLRASHPPGTFSPKLHKLLLSPPPSRPGLACRLRSSHCEDGRNSSAEDKLKSLVGNKCMYRSKWEQLKKKKKEHKIHWGPRCHRNWCYSLLPIINGGLCYYSLLETSLSPALHCSMRQPPHS